LNKLDTPLNSNERYLYEINMRLNVLIDMMGSFLEVYANQNSVAVEENTIEEIKEEELDGQLDIVDVVYEKMTKRELMEALDNMGIEYNSRLTKAELIELLNN
jgi:hypothetical protein